MEEQTSVSQSIVPTRINLNLDQVKKIALDLYGLYIEKIKELNGYDDKNYHVTDEDNNNFILKIINSKDSEHPDIFEAQTLLLFHLAKHGINCSTPIKTKKGNLFEKYQLKSGNHIIRLLKYIDGTTLSKIPVTLKLFYQIGQTAARMDNVMKNFSHPAYDSYKSLWMLDSVSQLYHFLDAVKNDKRRSLVKTIIDQFTEKILPLSKTLEKGLIHGDINEQNIIVEEKGGAYQIKAIIDYGDCHIGCYVYELAITMVYMMILVKDIAAGKYVIAGYSSLRKISKQEFSILKLCVATRLCQSLVIGAYTFQKDPNNTYVLTTAENGWYLLEKIWNQPDEELFKIWRHDEINEINL